MSESKKITPTEAYKKYEDIYAAVRDRICLLHYPPGTKLSELSLAKEFNVSRTPIRRVLQRLEFEQLAQRRQGAHTIVTNFDLASLKDAYEIRMILFENIERLSPRQQWWSCENDLQELKSELKELRRVQDLNKFGLLHIKLQIIFSDIILNTQAKELLMQFYFKIARIWLSLIPHMSWKYEVDTVLKEVDSLIEAAKHKDIKAIGLISRNHISMNIRRMEAANSSL